VGKIDKPTITYTDFIGTRPGYGYSYYSDYAMAVGYTTSLYDVGTDALLYHDKAQGHIPWVVEYKQTYS